MEIDREKAAVGNPLQIAFDVTTLSRRTVAVHENPKERAQMVICFKAFDQYQLKRVVLGHRIEPACGHLLERNLADPGKLSKFSRGIKLPRS